MKTDRNFSYRAYPKQRAAFRGRLLVVDFDFCLLITLDLEPAVCRACCYLVLLHYTTRLMDATHCCAALPGPHQISNLAFHLCWI